MPQDGQRRILRPGPQRHHRVWVDWIVVQPPHVHHAPQPRRRPVLRAVVTRRNAIAGAAGPHGGFIRHGAGHRVDAHVVVDHQVIVRVLVRLVELLRHGDDIDHRRVVDEALRHRRGVIRGRIVVERDHAGTGRGIPGSDPDHGTDRSDAGIGELNAAVRIQAHLKCLCRTDARLHPFGHVDPTEDHVTRVGIVAHAAAGLGGVEIVEQRRDSRRSASHSPQRAAAAGALRGGKGQVAVGIEKHLRVGDAVEAESERQGKLARIVVAERDHRTALVDGAAVVPGA